MATITLQKMISGTTTKSVLTITESSRTSTKTNFKLTAKTNLVTSSGYVGTGIYLYGEVEISGTGITTQTKRLTLKGRNDSWNNTSVHTTNDTFEVNIPSTTTSVKVKFTCYYSDATSDKMSGTASLSLSKLISVLNEFQNNNSLNLEQSLVLSITRHDDSYINNLTLYFVGSSGQTQIAKFNDVSDGDSISLSQQQINTIYGLSPNSNSLSIKWDLETLSDTTNLGTSSLNSTAIITNANPQFSSFDYEDINTKTIQLTQDSKTSVSGFSNIKVSVTPATGTKGATIDHYLINNTLVSPSNLPYTIIGMVGDTINVYAVDTRGNSTSLSKKVSKFINYQKLGKGNATALRDGGSSTQTKLSFSGTFWQGNFGAVENTLKVKYRYKKVTDTSFVDGTTAIVLTESQNKFSFDDYVKGDSPDNGFILDKSYNIIVEIEDSLDKITFDNITLMAGSPAIDGHLNKVALGGEYDENLGGTQFWGDVYSNRYLVPFFAESEDWEEATADESMVEQPSIFDDTNTVESPSIEEFIESEEDSNE